MNFRRNPAYSGRSLGKENHAVSAYCTANVSNSPVVGRARLAAGGESGDAPAGPASTIALGYEFYISGLTLGHVDVSARIQGGGYQAQSTLDTKGLISIFWQAHIEACANGRLGAGVPKPALYDAYSTHRDKRQQVTVVYRPRQGPSA